MPLPDPSVYGWYPGDIVDPSQYVAMMGGSGGGYVDPQGAYLEVGRRDTSGVDRTWENENMRRRMAAELEASRSGNPLGGSDTFWDAASIMTGIAGLGALGVIGGGGGAGAAAGSGGGAATTYPLATGGPVTVSPLAGSGAGAAGAAGAAGGILDSSGAIIPGTEAAAASGGFGSRILNWLPEITGGVNALLGYRAADQAADAEVNALNAAIGEQRRQFDLTRSDWQPWMDAGRDALSNLSDPANNFLASPGYEWLRSEGQRDIGNSFSARGGAQSGNALRALSEFQTGLAQQDYGNWWNQQLARAGLGTTGTSNVTQAGQNAANATSNYLSGQGVSRASGVYGRNAALAGGINDVVENVLYRRGRRAA